MFSKTIGFIGGGRMTSSLVNGLVVNHYPPQNIWVSDISQEKVKILKDRFGVQTTQDNGNLIQEAEIVFLSVRPQNLHAVIREISTSLQEKKPLIVSLAAGIEEEDLRKWLGADVPIVRCMPNVPSSVLSGVSGLFANQYVSEEEKSRVESLFRSVGATMWFEEESALESVTVISGSGPAYFFLLMDIMQKTAMKMGLSQRDARILTLQTAFGASKMALESTEEIKDLLNEITSPNGITEAAVHYLEEKGVRELFFKAIQSADQRRKTLSALLKEEER